MHSSWLCETKFEKCTKYIYIYMYINEVSNIFLVIVNLFYNRLENYVVMGHMFKQTNVKQNNIF